MSDNPILRKAMLSPSMINQIKSPKANNNMTQYPSTQNSFSSKHRKSSQGNINQEVMNFNVNLNLNVNVTGQKNQNLNLNTSINLNPKNQKQQKITFENYKNITNIGQSLYVEKSNNEKVPSFLNKNKQEKEQKLNNSFKNQKNFPFGKLQSMGKFAKTVDPFANTDISLGFNFSSKDEFQRFPTFKANDGIQMKKQLKTENNIIFQSYMPQTQRQYASRQTRKDSFHKKSEFNEKLQDENQKTFKKKATNVFHHQKHWPSSMHQISLAHSQQFGTAHSLETNHKKQDNIDSPGINTKQQKQFWKKKNIDFADKLQNIENTIQKQQLPKKIWTIDDFQLFDKIGKGAQGDVFLSRQKASGFICVIKKMSKKRIKQQKIQHQVIRQLKIQTYLKHRHLTNLYGFFWDENYIYLILELMADGNISHFIKRKKKTSQVLAAHLIKQTIQCLKYMHTQNIIHRDLKPQNVFIHQDYIKVGDLGCAVQCNNMRNTIIGSLAYVSPEQLQSNGYDQKIDIWSIGILTYELLFGKPPFEDDVIKIAKGEKDVKLSKLVFPTSNSQNKIPQISQDAKDFIEQLLQQNPKDRIDMKAALKHPFLKKSQKDQSIIFQQINMC